MGMQAAVGPRIVFVAQLFKHPRLMHYVRLIFFVVLVNLTVLVVRQLQDDWRIADGSAARATSDLALINVAVAVLIRQQRFVDVIFAFASGLPRSWPLRLRWAASKVYHVGGIHVGAAVVGSAWLAAFTVLAAVGRSQDPALMPAFPLVLAALLVGITLLMIACALPVVRARRHNVFEITHRLGGWGALALFWALTVDLVLTSRGDRSAGAALVGNWRIWILLLVTASIVRPWLSLKRVPVAVERPSRHVVILRFDYGLTPPIGANIGLSRSPLGEWHAFAAVPTPGRTGYRLLISRAGDWTGDLIDHPPTHLWVKGIAIEAPLARVELLFHRIVYVVTGSGIGPALGQILAGRTPAGLVWSVRDPRVTYGDELVDEVLAAQPDGLVWDTTERGRPDLVQLAMEARDRFRAEAVFVVSNKATTWQVVHGMERRGIPGVGPIWDS